MKVKLKNDISDINECASGQHSCHIHAECINTFGNYSCQCRSSFFGDGYTCKHNSYTL